MTSKVILFLCLACPCLSLRFHATDDKEDGRPKGLHEIYPQMITCGMKSYFISSVKTGDKMGDLEKYGWLTRVRELKGDTYKVVTTVKTPMSHNMAWLCKGDEFFGLGGQYRTPKHWAAKPHFQGVRAVSMSDLAQLGKATKTMAFTGEAKGTGCIEKRVSKDIKDHSCEFDGRFSLHQKGDTTYLFARANTGMHKRWVQMRTSQDLKTWSNWQLVKMGGVDPYGPMGGGIYFFQVENWNSTHKAAFFPAVLEHGSGIFMTLSTDMANWSKPHLLRKLKTSKWAREIGGESESADDYLDLEGERVGEFPVKLLEDGRLLIQDRAKMMDSAIFVSPKPVTETSTIDYLAKWDKKIQAA